MTKSMRFRGCIYADPPRKRDGVRDITEITLEELQALDLIGLPVCVEHGGPQRGVIEAQHTDPVTGYTTVDYRLYSDVAGETLATLTKQGRLRDLSLCHNIYPDPNRPMAEWEKEPVEVSLCMQGGRPGTHIFRVEMSGKRPRRRANNSVCSINTPCAAGPNGTRENPNIMSAPASNNAPAESFGQSAQNEKQQQPAQQQQQQPPQQPQPPQQQPAQQQQQQQQPVQPQQEPQTSISKESEDFIACAMKLDEADQTVVLNKVQSLYGDLVDLKRKNADLERRFGEEDQKKKSEASDMAREIVKVIDGIYSEYLGAGMTESEQQSFSSDLATNASCLKGLQNMRQATVAMSAQRKLSTLQADTYAAERRLQNAAMNSVRERMHAYETELAALDRGGAAPILGQVNAYAQPPPLQVAASNRTMSSARNGGTADPSSDDGRANIPDILRATLQSYDGNAASGNGRLYASDFVNSDAISGAAQTKRARVA
ncbi:hypothetical protein CYMTET_2739 [Cymbomonas tetramitiformis]|uniref:Uncharacterized protein n=1 Tax=Cymbomonas tetramitiformis TaxID=36881 RepID=A0AAE0H4I9_9CHLO|nr:hypothetical protein CYMTET_2739 [Cymbomonas tetramitiformis]